MKRHPIERAIRRAVYDKVGFWPGEVRAYVVDPAASPDADHADDAIELADLVRTGRDLGDRRFIPGCAIDAYIYEPKGSDGDLDCNLEIRFGPDMQILQVLSTLEVIHEESL